MVECKVDGCAKTANRVGAVLCEAHYMRLRRNGDFKSRLKPAKPTRFHSHGYVQEHNPHHPMSDGQHVYQHRRVFYDAKGEGTFNCHWCECVVTWLDLHIDHLNENKKDNAIDNLVASCAVCNQKRGRWKVIAKMKHGGNVIEFQGEAYCQADWARKIGISTSALRSRVDRWGVEAAITRPKRSGCVPSIANSQWQRAVASVEARPMDLKTHTLASLGL